MKKRIYTIIFILSFASAKAQNTSVNIGPSMGPQDSTFVVPTGIVTTFNTTNHPGAGPYSNAEIVLCQGAVLTYDYFIGTSNIVTFYLDQNSTLIFPTTSQGTIANFYMMNNATLQIPSTININAYMKRESGVNLAGMPITFFYDSVFSNINFTFNGWTTNPCSTSSTSSASLVKESIVFENPIVKNVHILSNTYTKPVVIEFNNMIGQRLHIEKIEKQGDVINCNLPVGLIYYTVRNEHEILQTGKLINQ